MNKPELLGIEVLTPDGRGDILTLHNGGVTVSLNTIEAGQVMKGRKHGAEMHYFYRYEDVEIIKGRYCFDDKHIDFQYGDRFTSPEQSEESQLKAAPPAPSQP